MPTVYLRKDLYDAIIQAKEEVNQFVNKVVEDALKPPKMVSVFTSKSAGKQKGGKS